MNANDPLGQVLRDGDTIGLRYERQLAHPPERVWRAITESDQVQHWLPTDIVGVALLDTGNPSRFIDQDPTGYEETYATLIVP